MIRGLHLCLLQAAPEAAGAASEVASGFPWPDSPFLWAALILAAVMLIWDTVEVGRNDAANLVNAVYGARILTRNRAVILAGIGAVLGAGFSSTVVETARKGIFHPDQIPELFPDPTTAITAALAIYIGVYIVDTVMLYSYSAFGMPVSTTACLVFELLGASFAVGGMGIVNWGKAGTVVFAIICSIVISFIAAFIAQRAIRGAIRNGGQRLSTLLLHGGWVAGGMLAGLTYFMLIKGMKKMPMVKAFHKAIIEEYGAGLVIVALWALFGVLVHMALVIGRKTTAKWLFPILAMIGTVAMAFAFGQNDLANCASPGLAALAIIEGRADGVAAASKVPISQWMLFGCGFLLLIGMATKNAARVTRAETSTGSMSNTVALYAPRWCIGVARMMLRFRGKTPSLAPSPVRPDTGEVRDYDVVRACVILCVSASVIATASSLGLPVSTTYVAFAAVIATAAADRVHQRGDAELKMGRTVWVIFSWFTAAAIAAVAAGFVSFTLLHLEIWGIALCLIVNVLVRVFVKKRGDAQEARVEMSARERQFPEQFTDYEG